jgi:hypothetical protein
MAFLLCDVGMLSRVAVREQALERQDFAAVVAMLAVGPIVAFGVTIGQTDNFEDGSLRNWQAGGFTNPNAPANITSGGPSGATDNYLRLTSNGSSGAGGRLVAFCFNQWTGNYLIPSVSSLRMQVNNLGATNLALRLIFENASVGQSLGTLSPVNVAAGSGWTTVTFSLASANLTGGAFNLVMGNVTTLNLVHSPSVITDRSSAPRIAAQLGVDNITAVPEPSVLVLATAGLATVICWASQNRTKRR